ncbi:hypothetical protein TREES_T100017214 [Tupaia chinensis]|uniref:ZMYM2-like/QRICH1 C-terminal domain-containing protein n=1 Tax=Tupaia chinensis TaxID=246437 RepID=L9JYY2_TUPCH|nr:hypothetical protein TREES_T100017214 [Tupaia chinensis]
MAGPEVRLPPTQVAELCAALGRGVVAGARAAERSTVSTPGATQQCPCCCLYKYMYVHRPSAQMEAMSSSYLTAGKEATDVGSVWYEEQQRGLLSLQEIVPNLAKKDQPVKLNFTLVLLT